MRRPLVAGNWKMNGSLESVNALMAGIKATIQRAGGTEVAVCPPFVYLAAVADAVAGTEIRVGSQDVSERDPGAFTGEIAAPMLRDFACTYAIVGHSERRSLYGETDALVAQKFVRAHQEGLRPILCVGESLEEREAGETENVVARQLDAVLDLAGPAALGDGVIAYEPVWAIGTGRTATPEQAQEVHAFLRGRVAGRDQGVADGIRILYGGSVKASNAASLMAMADIDGGLIGGASLQAEEFLAICEAAG